MNVHNYSLRLTCTLFFLAVSFQNARSADLMEVYNLAERSDPQFQQVAANKRAVLESRPQAYSQLMPSVNLTANTFHNEQDTTVGGDAPFGGGDFEFNSRGYNLNLRQPLFRWERFLNVKQANSSIREADAQLAAAQQDLMVRVAEAYFNVLAARDSLDFARAEKRSLSRQLDQTKQRFDVGLTAITDVQEARAGYDRAVAAEIAAENEIDNAREALREIAGQYFTSLEPLSDEMPLVTPEPADIEVWTDIAVRENLEVIAARSAVERSRQEVDVQQAGHLPTLDLVTRFGEEASGGRFGTTTTESVAVGVEFNLPIFQGGFVSSRAREARHRVDEQLERLEQARRQAHRLTRQAYHGIISGISQIKALDQAVLSSETALQATEAGYQVGTRTAVDVVTSERTTFEARRNYARARYDYIVDTLRLKRASGLLSHEDLVQINMWLE